MLISLARFIFWYVELIIDEFLFQEQYEHLLANKPNPASFLQVRKNLKGVKSKYRHKLADITDLEEVGFFILCLFEFIKTYV